MKTLKLLSVALISSLVLSTSVMASSNGNAATKKATEALVREQVYSALSELSTPYSGTVYITFGLTIKHGFEVLDVEGSNFFLNADVENELMGLIVTFPASAEGKYTIAIRIDE